MYRQYYLVHVYENMVRVFYYLESCIMIVMGLVTVAVGRGAVFDNRNVFKFPVVVFFLYAVISVLCLVVRFKVRMRIDIILDLG